MALKRIHFENREDWLLGRRGGIGASDAAAILGLSPWKSSVQLWLEKVSDEPRAETAANEAMEKGISLENPVRELFATKHAEYELEYYPYDILYQDDTPWLYATLDGELLEKGTGRRGIYEGKTSTCIKRTDWDKWKDAVPMHYFVQVLWQMLATGYDFAWLCAFLMNMEGDRCEYREYLIERKDHAEDLKMILNSGEKFWRYIETKTMPPMTIAGITI